MELPVIPRTCDKPRRLFDSHRHHDSADIVDVLANQVYAPRRAHKPHWLRTAESRPKLAHQFIHVDHISASLNNHSLYFPRGRFSWQRLYSSTPTPESTTPSPLASPWLAISWTSARSWAW